MQFEDKPDYNYIRSLFKSVFDKFDYQYDFVYDWYLLKKQNDIVEAKNQLNERETGEGKILIKIITITYYSKHKKSNHCNE